MSVEIFSYICVHVSVPDVLVSVPFHFVSASLSSPVCGGLSFVGVLDVPSRLTPLDWTVGVVVGRFGIG